MAEFHVLEFRTMTTIQHAALSVFLFLCGISAAAAEHPAPHFNPGEWEVSSVTTQSGGRTVSSVTTLCAREQMDFWKVAQAGLECKPAKILPEHANSIRVKITCDYDDGTLRSEIRSDAVETFSNHGDNFTLAGTTTTHTVYQGVQPKQTSVKLDASARRVGPCK